MIEVKVHGSAAQLPFVAGVSSVLALGSIHVAVITKPVGELSQLITLLTTLAAIPHILCYIHMS